MAQITSFGSPADFGGAVGGWSDSFGSDLYAVEDHVRLNANSAGTDITGINVKMYTGWSEASGGASPTSSIVRSVSGDTITLTNFSWTLDAAAQGNLSVNRNNSIHSADVQWDEGKWLIKGDNSGHRFGWGTGNIDFAGTITGSITNQLIQASNARVILQLNAFAPGVLSNFAMDDFTHSGGRVDANFPGGTSYTGIDLGTADSPDLNNGNTSGQQGSTQGTPFTPTVVRGANFRRRGTLATGPANRHRHSPKHTPMYFVDPTFTIVDNVDTSLQNTVEVTEGFSADGTSGELREWFRLINSSDGTTQRIPRNSGVWFVHEVTYLPANAIGTALSGHYWVLNEQNQLDALNVYEVDGITNANDYLPTQAGAISPFQQTGLGTETGEFLLLATDQFVNTTSSLVYDQPNNADIPLVDLRDKNIVVYVDGYDPMLIADINPRDTSVRGTQRPVATPTGWLQDENTELSLNNAAKAIYTHLRSNPELIPGRVETWTDNVITLNSGSSGNILVNSGTQSYDGFDWSIGNARQANSAVTNVAGNPVTDITTITATEWNLNGNNETFNGQGITWNLGTIASTLRLENGTFTTGDSWNVAGGDTVEISDAEVSGLTINRAGGTTGTVTVRLLAGVTGVPTLGADVEFESSLVISGATSDSDNTISVYLLNGGSPAVGATFISSAASTTLSSSGSPAIAAGESYRIVWSRPGFEHYVEDVTIAVGVNDPVTIVRTGTPSSVVTTFSTAAANILYTANTMRVNPDGTVTDIGARGVISISGARGSAFGEAVLSETETNGLFESVKGSNAYNVCIAQLLSTTEASPIGHPADTTTTLAEDFYFLDTGNSGAGQRITSLLELPAAGGNAIDVADVQLIYIIPQGGTDADAISFGAVEIAVRSSGASYGDILAIDANAGDRTQMQVDEAVAAGTSSVVVNGYTTDGAAQAVALQPASVVVDGYTSDGETAVTNLQPANVVVQGYTADGEQAVTGLIQRSGAV